MKLAIITDTSADVAEKYTKRPDFFQLEIPISINGKDYEPSKMTHEEWFKLMASAKEAPKIAQPSILELESLLTKLQTEGYTDVLGLFLPSGISGFYANAYYLQNEFEGMNVTFPETFITSGPLGYLIESAFNNYDDGQTFDDILTHFNYQRDNDNAFMLLDDLHWLAKGGRLSHGAEFFGSLLNIKPLLQFSEDGRVVIYDKVRTMKKAVAEVKKLLVKNAKTKDYHIYVLHSGAPERAQELYDYAWEQGYRDVTIVTFGPVIATHLGLGAVAYGVTPK